MLPKSTANPKKQLAPAGDWTVTVDRPDSLPVAKAGNRRLMVAFAIFRIALVITAVISLGKVAAQLETKFWFQNHLLALTFLDRAYADIKTAKGRIYDYVL